MKKLLISALALASLVACSKEEVVVEQAPGTIAFDQAFVENTTRAAEDPSMTLENLTAFDAWGFMDQESGVVFDQQRVSRANSTSDWSYSPLQYWLPNHNYYFAAVTPVDDQNITVEKATGNDVYNGLGTISFTNVNGTTDLMYSTDKINTNGWAVGEAKEKVTFIFNHLLSKVKFTFKNGFAADNYSVVVKDIKMAVPGDGEIDLAVASDPAWVLGTTATTLEFGHVSAGSRIGAGLNGESDAERLTIPAVSTQEYEVTFYVELYSGDVLAYSNALKTTVKNVALEIGKAYNFSATLDHTNIAGTELKPIVFTVQEIDEWDVQTDTNLDPMDTEVIGVATATDLYSVLQGNLLKSSEIVEVNIRLLNDITLEPKTLEVKSGVKATIDLNGKTLKNSANWTESDGTTNSYVFHVPAGAELTLKGNGTVAAIESQYAMAVWADGGKVTINGGTYTNAGNGSDVIYAKNGGTVAIYGGTFVACEKQPFEPGTKEKYSALNLHDGTKADSKIEVYGGLFRGFDPANNKSENPAISFVADGYVSKEISVEGDEVPYYQVLPASVLQEVATADELQNALNAGGQNIVLTTDITSDKSFFVNADITAVLDLNGFNITNSSNSGDLEVGDGIIVYGNLTINGKGIVSAPTRAVWARSSTGAIVTINGGTYKGSQVTDGATEVIYASGDGKIYINDGVFQAVNEDKTSFAKPQYAALNLHGNGKDGCSIVVKGGKFYRFDPANNVSENPVEKGNFVAEGYMSYKVDADWYAVTDNITRVSTEDDLHAAFAKGGAIMLTKNIDAKASFIVKDDVTAVLDLNGYNITNTSNSLDLEVGDGIIVYGDLTINGKGTVSAATRAVWARGETGAVVTINGGNYEGATQDLNEVVYASGNGKVNIYNGTFKALTQSTQFAQLQYAALNLHDASGKAENGADIKVYGGKFFKFNPADNVSENPKKDFVAQGYESVAEGDYYVVKVKAITE